MYMDRQRQKIHEHRLMKQEQELANYRGPQMMGGGLPSDGSFNVPHGRRKNTQLDPIGFVEEQRDSREQDQDDINNIEVDNTYG